MIASPRTSSWRPVDAWRALNDAACDLALLGAVATDEALASDLTVLADAVERELEALFRIGRPLAGPRVDSITNP